MFFNLLMKESVKTIALIVAHPDDETLWAGGTILSNPGRRYFIASLCRKTDPDRAPKFKKALDFLGAGGIMGDLDDDPEQIRLTEDDVQNLILKLLPSRQFDLIITHSIYGEYSRHRRHEEIGNAVIQLWHSNQITAAELWAFAFEDGQGSYYPAAIEGAPLFYTLPQDIWQQKYHIITNIYGFDQNSWEAQTTPKEEAFWQFYNAGNAFEWLINANITP